MSSTLLRTLSKHSWNGEPIVVPPRAHPHNGFGDKHSAIDVRDSSTPVTELDKITFDASGLPFAQIQSATTTGPASSVNEAGGEKGRREKRKYRTVLAAIFWCFFTLGLNDGSTGPLLPVYQEYYGISFLTVSMIFISNCMGCLTSAFLNVIISRRMAFSKILILATVLQIAGYALLSPAAAFPVMCVAFFINGMGMSLLNAQCNSLLSMLHNPTAMGLAHASYGIGALIAPLISTQFARLYTDSHMANPGSGKWALHYTVLLVAALSDLISFAVLLKGRGYDEILSEMGAPAQEHEEVELTRAVVPAAEEPVAEVGNSSGDEGGESGTVSRKAREGSSFGMVLKQVHVHILAAFVFIYVGLEVTIGGWIVTFMINERGGGASAGYVSSGFFGGLALGRVTLLWVNKKLGERNAIFLYVAVGIALEMVVWFVPSLIGNAVAVSFVGLVLGPFYPIVMSQTGRIIPRKVLSGSIGWIAGFGQSGSAVLPFMTGALANKYGIISLQPLIVAMMAAMAVLWFAVPSIAKRRE